MSFRDDIIDSALNWAGNDPGWYKPTAGELISFFTDASTQQAPSQTEAQQALDRGGTGVYVGGQLKQWCGIFACSVAVDVGLSTLSWDLLSGLIKGADVQLIYGNTGIQAGDIAAIARYQHHFIVTASDDGSGSIATVEGNTGGQLIKQGLRNVSEIAWYYSILR